MALRRTPYVASTLELYDDREVCSVDFRGLDCVTFFELALAFARMLKRDERTPAALLADVTFLRYRGGHVTDLQSLTGCPVTHVVAMDMRPEPAHGPAPEHETSPLGPLGVLAWGGPKQGSG